MMKCTFQRNDKDDGDDDEKAVFSRVFAISATLKHWSMQQRVFLYTMPTLKMAIL